MDKPLKHPVPDILLETDIAILGQKGAGKSVVAKGLVERLLDMGRRTVVIDPLNHWYGLKALANGQPGYPVIVIGGPNADIPLNIKGGERLGEVLASSPRSFVIDVSDLLKSDMIAFMTEFLGSLYRHNREALWLVLEEADVFAMQNPAQDGSRKMHDVCDQIARRGRQRGFRLWTVTQRPARLSKDLLTQASTLVLMRIRSPQDRSAAEDWIIGHAERAQAKAVIDGLAALEVGQGYVYAPDLDLLDRVRFPMIATLDTSGTPQAGETRPEVGKLATVDVEAIRKALEPPAPAPPQPAAASRKAPTAPPGADLEAIRREAKQAGHVEGYRLGHDEGYRVATVVATEMMQRALESIRPTPATADDLALRAHLVGIGEKLAREGAPMPVDESPGLVDVPRPASKPQPGGALKLLASAIRVHPLKMTWGQLCAIGRTKSTGGYFNTARRMALSEGWLAEDSDGYVSATQAGLDKLGAEVKAGDPIEIMGDALEGAAARIFDLVRREPGYNWVAIAQKLNMKQTGGYWNTGIHTLRRNKLLQESDAGCIYLASWLTEKRA